VQRARSGRLNGFEGMHERRPRCSTSIRRSLLVRSASCWRSRHQPPVTLFRHIRDLDVSLRGGRRQPGLLPRAGRCGGLVGLVALASTMEPGGSSWGRRSHRRSEQSSSSTGSSRATRRGRRLLRRKPLARHERGRGADDRPSRLREGRARHRGSLEEIVSIDHRVEGITGERT
jgi:hypothetical protein